MISVKSYTVGDLDAWNKFVRESRMPMFMFERGYMDYHSDRFKDASLMFYRDNDLMAVLPASAHGEKVISHGGLTYGGFIYGEQMKQHTMLECFDVMKRHYGACGARAIIYKTIPHIYHHSPAEEDLYALCRNGARLLKVEPSTTVSLKRPFKMPKGRKAQVSRARREGVSVKESMDFDSFIELENSVLGERHATKAVHSAEELRLLKSRFCDNIQLWSAERQGRMIAATLLFVYGDVVHTQYMAADESAREIGGLDLLIKTLMDDFAETKTYFDFGISTEDYGRVLNEGLISQKEGFGGRTLVYNTWRLDI